MSCRYGLLSGCHKTTFETWIFINKRDLFGFKVRGAELADCSTIKHLASHVRSMREWPEPCMEGEQKARGGKRPGRGRLVLSL